MPYSRRDKAALADGRFGVSLGHRRLMMRFMIWLVAACGVFVAALHPWPPDRGRRIVAAASVTIIAKIDRTHQGEQ